MWYHIRQSDIRLRQKAAYSLNVCSGKPPTLHKLALHARVKVPVPLQYAAFWLAAP
jgi:hypothetical protein